ncbi:putative Fibroblast growth factor receptor 4 [Hypsibius exemplaris]|uniref:Fibroblast growth factor receptor 4 n=1 Tax=Hypsibius exemplaris TaxID=2072580 RepID=A0A1W0WEG0_HYPEX|nr:putative Fibroblast growth factor receptor 4 [Hypsibius exemplaris]
MAAYVCPPEDQGDNSPSLIADAGMTARSSDECPLILNRTEWGSRVAAPTTPRLLTPVSEVYFLQTLFPDCEDLRSCKCQARQAEGIHMSEDRYRFPAIGYNFMVGIDSNGTLFEGRGFFIEGEYPEPRPDQRRISYSVAFLGNFSIDHSRVPRKESLESVLHLLNCAVSQNFLSKDYVIHNYAVNLQTLEAFNLLRNYTPSVATITSDHAVPGPIIIAASASSGGCLLLFGVLIYFLWRKRNSRTRDLYLRMLEKIPAPVLHRYIIPPTQLIATKHDGGNELGTGHFGIVIKARLRPNGPKGIRKVSTDELDVAVKVLKDDVTEKEKAEQQRAFLMEMEMLMKVGRHVNIVNLIGIVLQDDPMIVMEYCCLGSLYEFLRNDQYTSCFLTDELSPSPALYAVHGVDDLINLGFQISRGMEFVSARGMIHRDLAARNILLDGRKVAKIADFGLAREQMEYSLAGKNAEVPWRWLAIESLVARQGVFSTKSDVWSFGITFWEILSLCRQLPYRAEQNGQIGCAEILDFLTNGRRLSRPELCTIEVYAVMKQCWAADPQDRPTFTELTRLLSALLPEAMQHEYLQVDQTNKEYNKLLDQEYRCSTDL